MSESPEIYTRLFGRAAISGEEVIDKSSPEVRRYFEIEKLKEELDREKRNSAYARGFINRLKAENKALEASIVSLQHTKQRNGQSVQTVPLSTVPEKKLHWNSFPVDVYPDPIKDYIEAHAAAKNCDPAFIAVPALIVLSSAIGNSYGIQIKRSWQEIACLWGLIIAPSGKYKTPGLHAAAWPIYQKEKEAGNAYNEAEAQYQQDLEAYKTVKAKERKPEGKPEKPNRQRFRASNTTLESLALVHGQNTRGITVICDELAGLFGSFDKYSGGSSDMQSWIEMHGGKPVTIDRKTSDIPVLTISSPNVPVVGGIQPKVFKSTVKPDFFNSGYIARYLMAMPPVKEKVWSEEDVDSVTKDAYADVIDKLYNLPMIADEPFFLDINNDAKQLFIDYYNEHARLTDKLPDGPLRAAMTKLEFMAARIALVLHLAFHVAANRAGKPGPIEYTPMLRGIQLACWFRREIARIYQLMDFERINLDKDQQLVLQLPNPFKYQDVEKTKNVQQSGAFKIIRHLQSKGYIEKVTENQYKHRISQHLIDWSIFDAENSEDSRTVGQFGQSQVA